MSDYIKREDVLNGLDKLCDIVCPYSKKQRSVMCGACTLGSAFDAIEEMTAADVVERKTGKWSEEYKCSECGYSAVIRVEHDGSVVWESEPFNFCPNCGADMRGES